MQEGSVNIDKIIEEADDFRLWDYIGRGFDLFKKDMGGFIGFTLIYFLLTTVIGAIPFVGSIANSLLVGPVMIAGFYLVARRLDRGEAPDFGQYFKGFDFTGKLALAALVTSLIVGSALVPFIIAVWDPSWLDWYQELLENPGDPNFELPVVPPLWTLLLLLPVVYLGIAYTFTYHFILFHGLDFWPAMEASRRLLTKHFFMFFLFGLVLGLMLVCSILVFCVGILAGLPFMYCAFYAAFADLTKLNIAPSEEEGIEKHLVD